jgi:hypothetical protein
MGEKMYIQGFSMEKMSVRDHLEDPNIDEKIILKRQGIGGRGLC